MSSMMGDLEISSLRIRIDGTNFIINTFNDAGGFALQQSWKLYIDSLVIPRMNPATLYQMDRYS